MENEFNYVSDYSESKQIISVFDQIDKDINISDNIFEDIKECILSNGFIASADLKDNYLTYYKKYEGQKAAIMLWVFRDYRVEIYNPKKDAHCFNSIITTVAELEDILKNLDINNTIPYKE